MVTTVGVTYVRDITGDELLQNLGAIASEDSGRGITMRVVFYHDMREADARAVLRMKDGASCMCSARSQGGRGRRLVARG